jgi:hypothetical protein
VSWLGEIIGFRARDDDDKPSSLERTVFDFAIVPDEVFCADAKCPHCGSYSHPELIEPVESMVNAYTGILGDLMICTDCQMLYLIVEAPVIKYDKPIMTRWAVPEKIYKKN